MLELYLVTFTFGSVLIAASVLLGGSGEDLDKDLDLAPDADADADGFDIDKDLPALGGTQDLAEHAGAWLPFLSLRFWTFGAASFGATGLLLELAGTGSMVSAPVAVASGSVIGTVAAWFFQRLKRDRVSGDTSLKRFVGEQATVVLAIRPDRAGTIRIETAAGDLVVPARTRDKHDLASGSAVLIAAFDGRTADVTGLPGVTHPSSSAET